jgi:hypothetical protein
LVTTLDWPAIVAGTLTVVLTVAICATAWWMGRR